MLDLLVDEVLDDFVRLVLSFGLLEGLESRPSCQVTGKICEAALDLNEVTVVPERILLMLTVELPMAMSLIRVHANSHHKINCWSLTLNCPFGN